jgi:hypothetical protein
MNIFKLALEIIINNLRKINFMKKFSSKLVKINKFTETISEFVFELNTKINFIP